MASGGLNIGQCEVPALEQEGFAGGFRYRPFVVRGVRLAKQDRQERRRVDDHCGSPCSS